MTQTEAVRCQRLTSRELQVLSLTSDGLTDAQIARRLGTSCRTVGAQQSHIRRKLNVNNRVQAVGIFAQMWEATR